ncbi:uncharacterized protein [Parasteatoda tepidariorum]|uniref:uncharacterized protein isoform X1 n=1 Tax=Parasteatoda tepidariorum TaxID=114398 RepID=UPI0039BCA9D4
MLASDTMQNVFENNNYKMNGRVHLKPDVNSQTVTDKGLCKFCDRPLYGLKNDDYEQYENEEKEVIAHGETYYNGHKYGDNGDEKSAFNGETIKMFCIFCNQYYNGPKKAEYAREPFKLNKGKKASSGGNSALDNDRVKTVIDVLPFEDGRKSPPMNSELLNEESGDKEVVPYDTSLESNEEEKIILNGHICQRDDCTKSVSDKMASDEVDGHKTKIGLGGNLSFKKNRKIMIVTNGVLFESAYASYKAVVSEVPPKIDQENKIIGELAETKKNYIACVGTPFMRCEKAKTFCYGVPPVAGFPILH